MSATLSARLAAQAADLRQLRLGRAAAELDDMAYEARRLEHTLDLWVRDAVDSDAAVECASNVVRMPTRARVVQAGRWHPDGDVA